MSGGSLNYFYSELESHVGDFGDKELDDLVHDLAELFHDREWYLSADTGVGNWNEARDNFKAKWFTKHGRQERIERYLSEFAAEVRQCFGIKNKYCQECRHWTQEDGSEYGKCEYETFCLNHSHETCNKWEERRC